MINDPTAQGPLQMLLESMIHRQDELSRKQDETIQRMATKDDITQLVSKGEFLMLQGQFTTLSAKVDELRDNRLPKWFWPFLSAVVVFVAPICAAVVIHFFHWG